MKRLGAVVALLCSLLFASACGGGDSADGGPAAAGSSSAGGSPAADPSSPGASSAPSGPSSTPDAAGSADDAFCAGFDRNGGTLASIGEPPTFYPKEGLVTYAEETLAVLKGLTPPAAIAGEWTAYQQFHTRLLTAARALGAGQRLGGTLPGRAAIEPAYKKINAWITANC